MSDRPSNWPSGVVALPPSAQHAITSGRRPIMPRGVRLVQGHLGPEPLSGGERPPSPLSAARLETLPHAFATHPSRTGSTCASSGRLSDTIVLPVAALAQACRGKLSSWLGQALRAGEEGIGGPGEARSPSLRCVEAVEGPHQGSARRAEPHLVQQRLSGPALTWPWGRPSRACDSGWPPPSQADPLDDEARFFGRPAVSSLILRSTTSMRCGAP